MRAWLSFPIVKGIRTGISVNMNPAARAYPRASATGAKVWRIGSAIMLVGLAIWLFASMENGRLSEVWWLVTGLVLAARYIFKLVVVAIFPPQITPGQP
jgi:hypothetical protein